VWLGACTRPLKHAPVFVLFIVTCTSCTFLPTFSNRCNLLSEAESPVANNKSNKLCLHGCVYVTDRHLNFCTFRTYFCTAVPFERHVDMYLEEPYVDITYRVHLQRRPLYYVIYLILPTTVISFMSLLAFLLPSDSGEKIGLGAYIDH